MKINYFIILLCIIFTGCLSLMDKTGRLIDGSQSNEKMVALYRDTKKNPAIELKIIRNKNKEQSIVISTSIYPMIKLYTSLPDNENNIHFTSLYYLSGTAQGWNEFTLDIIGKGTLILGDTAVFSLTEVIEPIQISQGRIHRYDTRITGQEALTGLRNRRERIIATTDWMAVYSDNQKYQSLEEFEKYWKPVLFPELAPEKDKPANWRLEKDDFARAEDIRWNTGYTERVFNEILAPVRNSGTMLRDWEEAAAWIYMEYEWQTIMDFLSKEIELTKIK